MKIRLSLLFTCATPTDTGATEPHFDAPDAPGSFTAVTVQDTFVGRGVEEMNVQIWYTLAQAR